MSISLQGEPHPYGKLSSVKGGSGAFFDDPWKLVNQTTWSEFQPVGYGPGAATPSTY